MTEPTETSSPIAIRVLLVDNDKDHARAMTESLQRIGLDCTFATSGPDGIRELNENLFDIVVTDLMMNDVDGMGILKHVKETQPASEVVMVTGHATVPRAVEAMQDGAYNFLEKPITPKRIQAVVSKAADAARTRRRVVVSTTAAAAHRRWHRRARRRPAHPRGREGSGGGGNKLAATKGGGGVALLLLLMLLLLLLLLLLLGQPLCHTR